jgi:hypothetical protein
MPKVRGATEKLWGHFLLLFDFGNEEYRIPFSTPTTETQFKS